jgi:HlyD family secretion protein
MDHGRWRRWAMRAVLAGGLLAGGIAGALFFFRPPQVTVAVAAAREIAPVIQGVGTVEAKTVVRVSAKITGRLVSVLVDQGDSVRAGQLVATLDRAEQQAQVAQAEAAVQRARMAVIAQEVALRKAAAGVQAAEATVGRLTATEGLAKVNADRWRQLHQEGGVSRIEMDVRVTEAIVAGQELRNVEAQRRVAEEEVAVGQAAVDTLRQEVRVAEAALAATRARQADTEVRSPLDGVVVLRELEAGATVNPGSGIFKIADPRTAWVTVHVDERDLGSLSVGYRAEISLRSLPGRSVPGRIARIQRESDRVTEQLAVDIALLERPERLTLGEQAEARIRPPARHGAVGVPLGALVRTADGPGVWTVVAGRLAYRPVRVGVLDPGGWVEALDGVREGDEVVVAPGRLADPRNEGRRVIVVRAQPTGRSPAGTWQSVQAEEAK